MFFGSLENQKCYVNMIKNLSDETFVYERVLYVIYEDALYMYVDDTATIVQTQSPVQA